MIRILSGIVIPTFIAGFGILALSYGFGWLLLPRLSEELEPFDEEEAAQIAEERKVHIDLENPLRIHVEVDYSDGVLSKWYPKGESPILSELVDEGKLPPVKERVGPEPVVFRGVEGIGEYGGTWFRVGLSNYDIGGNAAYISGDLLVRWSPYGYPIVPHVAKNFNHSDDYREWTFHLREGMKWSDGHPFTAEDILYWWEWDVNYFGGSFASAAGGGVPEFMRVEGQLGNIVMVDPLTVKFVFPRSYPFFLERLVSNGSIPYKSPKHYMQRFHPELGDKELIESTMGKLGIGSPESLYRNRQDRLNPDHPRIWPWIYRTYKPGAPQVFVRNPYYFAVDTEGNQLPYIDRVFWEVKPAELLPTTISSGRLGMHARLLGFNDYTEYMANREANGYEIYHWYISQSSYWAIWPNLNKRLDPDDPTTEMKSRLLNNRYFRRALSLAIDRKSIIEAVMSGYPSPAQLAPGPASPFYHKKLFSSYVEHDPVGANNLLDSLGLKKRDSEGYRTFPDGSRMVWYLNYPKILLRDPVQFVIDDWRKIGLRTVPKERSLGLFGVDTSALRNDLTVWQGMEQFLPLVGPDSWVPVRPNFYSAVGFARWYQWGGLYGDPQATLYGGIEPPLDHPLRRAMEVVDKARKAIGLEAQREILNEVFEIAAKEVWTISVFASPPHPVVVKNGFRNVPKFAIYSPFFSVPSNAGVDTYFIENANETPGTIAKIKTAITTVTPDPRLGRSDDTQPSIASALGRLISWLISGISVVGIGLLAFRHPFVARRLVILIPTLIIISLVAFVTIQLPPGDFIDSKILQLEATGIQANHAEMEEIRAEFHLDRSLLFQYLHWVGLNWFLTLRDEDRGLLQGNLGRSMEYRTSVNAIVGDRVLLTITVSFATMVFTTIVSLVIGIYSAVKQYSWGDYFFTFLGFVGMSVPGFLLALVLVYLSGKIFGVSTLGLFSNEFAGQAEWDWPKVLDLVQHLWMPVVVIGAAGIAASMRVMRGNLLDELNKPYVVAARAKGVRPLKLLLKYPVRLALNPFVSSIGYIFPQLISGGAIVAIVLSLPMVGPMILEAFLSEDLYLAGSMLMVLSILGVFGTLVSDLLLLWLDPRIRMEQSGSR